MVIIGSGLVTQLWIRPWRTYMGDLADCLMTLALFLFIGMAALVMEVRDTSRAQQFAFGLCVCMLSIAIVALSFFARGLLDDHLSKRKRFDAFVCHHKVASACFARMLKSELRARGSGGAIRDVFLDSDNLVDLATLFDTVRTKTQTLIVLMTKYVCTRPWCVGEITVAWMNDVPILPVMFPDFDRIYGIENIISVLGQGADVLPRNGLSFDDVKAALTGLQNLVVTAQTDGLPPLFTKAELRASSKLTRALTSEVASPGGFVGYFARSLRTMATGTEDPAESELIDGLRMEPVPNLNAMNKLVSIVASALTGISRGAQPPTRTFRQDVAGNVVIVNSAKAYEALAVGHEIWSRVMKCSECDINEWCVVTEDGIDMEAISTRMMVRNSRCLVLLCTTGCFDDHALVVLLAEACQMGVPIVPVVTSPLFEFPNASVVKVPGVDAAKIVKSVFTTIAVNINTHASEVEITAACTALVDRVKGATKCDAIRVIEKRDGRATAKRAGSTGPLPSETELTFKVDAKLRITVPVDGVLTLIAVTVTEVTADTVLVRDKDGAITEYKRQELETLVFDVSEKTGDVVSPGGHVGRLDKPPTLSDSAEEVKPTQSDVPLPGAIVPTADGAKGADNGQAPAKDVWC